jgi:hypothetical protein
MRRATWTTSQCALVLVAATVALATPIAAAVTFNISPASITIRPSELDCLGPITFRITGLTLGQSVVVEEYADLNRNGSIDAGEPLLERFTVTDGQLPLIAGVRNMNVPGDDDGAENGQITATDFCGGLKIAGAYVLQLSDPAQEFAPVAQPFTVNQSAAPQGITGTVTAAASGQPVAHVPVMLTTESSSAFVAGAFADANGQYTLYTAPGSYKVVLLTVGPGYVANWTVGPTTVAAGQFVTQNTTLLAAGLTVSGMVSDAATGAGLPGLGVGAQSSTGLAAFGFTDSTGNYTFQVTAGNWQISPQSVGPGRLGYVAVRNKSSTTIAGNLSMNFQFPKVTALIYGTVMDTQGIPVGGLQMIGSEPNGPQQGKGHTFPPGADYSIGVVGGSWGVEPNGDDLAALGCSDPTGSVMVAPSDGQAVRQDFRLQCSIPTPTPTPSPTTCVGDCDGSGDVTVNEIITLVNMALGSQTQLSACPHGLPADLTDPSQVDVSLIIKAVNNALNGCAGD